MNEKLNIYFINKASESEIAEVYFLYKKKYPGQSNELSNDINEYNIRHALDKKLEQISFAFYKQIEQDIDNLEGMVTREKIGYSFLGLNFKLKPTLTPAFNQEDSVFILRKKITLEYFNNVETFIYQGSNTVAEILQHITKNLEKVQKEIEDQQRQRKKVEEDAVKEAEFQKDLKSIGLDSKGNSVIINLKKPPFKDKKDRLFILLKELIEKLEKE